MQRVDLSRNWRFYEGEEGNSYIFACQEGEIIDLPHDFIIGKQRSADAPGAHSNGYFGNGQGVYRKTLDVPDDWKEKTILLDVDGAYMNMEVSLNKEVLAIHPNGYIPYQVDLTPALRFDGRKNRLKILTQSRQPSTRWYSGGGLYRDVCLWVGNPVHIRPWDVFITTPKVYKDRAVVDIACTITGTKARQDISMDIQIYDQDGKEAGRAERKVSFCEETVNTTEMDIVTPRLWSLDDPCLYTCKITLESEGEVLDVSEYRFGIRTIQVDAEQGFRLNGETMKLKGGCIHHDNGLLGACAYPKADERKIRMMKEAGYNAIRFSHYPPSLEFLNLCDRIGMLVLDEAFDAWKLGKVPMDYHLYFEEWWERDIECMVKRDRNHPCVITYSIGNEINESNGKNGGPQWARRLAAKVRELDDTRFVLSAICGLAPDVDDEDLGSYGNLDINMQTKAGEWNTATREFCEPLDIVGYNYLKHIYEESHAMYPNRVILGSETFAFDTYDYWEETKKHSYVIGDCIWTAVDYLGEVGLGKVHWTKPGEKPDFLCPYPWRTAWDADIDLTGESRPQGIYRRIMWGDTSLSGIYTTHPRHFGQEFTGTGWHWPDVNDCWSFGEEWIGKPVKVELYGAGDEAEFIRNGVSLGKAKFDRLKAVMKKESEYFEEFVSRVENDWTGQTCWGMSVGR